MLAVVVEFKIEPGYVAAFHDAIVANAQESLRTEPCCRQFDVCRDAADPALFFLYELYDDEAAFEVHLQMPHFLEMNNRTAGWVVSKSVRRLQVVTA
jgi:quinol monooxygenase YgiN